jgi:hypothetical protein
MLFKNFSISNMIFGNLITGSLFRTKSKFKSKKFRKKLVDKLRGPIFSQSLGQNWGFANFELEFKLLQLVFVYFGERGVQNDLNLTMQFKLDNSKI